MAGKRIKKQDIDLITDVALITPEQEEKQVAEISNKIENLADLTIQLEEMRKVSAYQARLNDIKHVENMDKFMNTVLEELVCEENLPKFKKAIGKLLDKGDMHGLNKLMMAIKMTQEARETLLGFDDTRGQNKRKMKLQAVFKGPDGSQVGVSVEN